MTEHARLLDLLLGATEGMDDRQLKAFRRQLEARLPEFISAIAAEARNSNGNGKGDSNVTEDYASKVSTAIGDFQARSQAIERNSDLSPAGREKQRQALVDQALSYKPKALDSLGAEWRQIQKQAQALEAKKAEAAALESARWDYQRLAYLAQNVKAAIQRAHNPGELSEMYDRAKNSRDPHLQRAWAEAAPAAALSRFGGEIQVSSLATRAAADLQRLTTTPELEAAGEGEAKLAERAIAAHGATMAARDFYAGPPIALGYQAELEFGGLLEGVEIGQRFDPETGRIVRSVQISDQEPRPREEVSDADRRVRLGL